MFILMCLFVTGCTNDVKVTGSVTYSDNGESVQSGMVVFTGEKMIGRGAIKEGKYSVGLIRDGDGIPPGTYTVSADLFGMHPTFQDDTTPPPQTEVYYTKEPQTIDVNKKMTYDFMVERGKRR